MVRIWVASLHQKTSTYESTLRFLFYCKVRLTGRVDPNSCGADRRLRRKQGGEAGTALRFFKALPRGCRKISKRNPSGPAQQGKQSATARLCLACGCQPVGMSNKRTTVHPGKNRTVLKPVKHICVLVFLFSVRREGSSYPFLFFIQIRYSPSVMRVSRYRMGVQHASRMGMGRFPVA